MIDDIDTLYRLAVALVVIVATFITMFPSAMRYAEKQRQIRRENGFKALMPPSPEMQTALNQLEEQRKINQQNQDELYKVRQELDKVQEEVRKIPGLEKRISDQDEIIAGQARQLIEETDARKQAEEMTHNITSEFQKKMLALQTENTELRASNQEKEQKVAIAEARLAGHIEALQLLRVIVEVRQSQNGIGETSKPEKVTSTGEQGK